MAFLLPYDTFAQADQSARQNLKLTLTAYLKGQAMILADMPVYDENPVFNHALDDPWAELVYEHIGTLTRVNAGDILRFLGAEGVSANHERLGRIMIALGWTSSRSSTIPGRRIYRKGKLSTRAR